MSLLVTVSGQDRPGITSTLTGLIARDGAKLLDFGQAVLRGHLVLSLLFETSTPGEELKTLKDLLFAATELGLKLEYQNFDDSGRALTPTPQSFRYTITVLGSPLSAAALHAVTNTLSHYAFNIDTIQPLSEGDLTCVEFAIHSTREFAHRSEDAAKLKHELLSIAQTSGVDIAFQEDGLFRRAKRLIVFDMDSTLIQNEVIDEFARERGCYNKVAAITKIAMEGGLTFDESLKRRCAEIKGLTEAQIESVWARIQITPGAEPLVRTLKTLGYKIALISGGFTVIAERLRQRLGLDYVYANTMVMKNGVFTGEVLTPIVNAQRKADLLDLIAQNEGLIPEQVIAVGDGANDLKMLERAGLGIAFDAKPAVRAKADLAISQKDLSGILFLLGIRARDLR